MAGVTRNPRGMFDGMHLRKIHRLGIACFVASGTQHCRVQFWRDDASGIFGVSGLRTVARFACHPTVASEPLHLQNIIVTILAHLVACIRNWLGSDLSQSRTTVVTKFAKTLRHQQTAQSEEYNHPSDERRRKPNQVCRILYGNHGSAGPKTRRIRPPSFGWSP